MKKVLLITTGGTIASSEEKGSGLTPTFDAEQLLAYMPEIKENCDITGKQIMSIDSTNMNPKLMIKIAETIYENYKSYDGFVVTHGTDTMGYTSAALVYMLQNIKKPVVVTGAQIAISALYTDAKKNISDAIRFALEDIAGVFVAFDGKIINGTRAMKVRTKSMNAFESENYPDIATIKLGRIKYTNDIKHLIYPDPTKPFQLNTSLCENVLVLKLHPGIDPKIFDYIKENYQGVIIESFGIGGIPSEEYDIISKVKELIDAGKAVVIGTQCLEEGIDLEIYKVGRELAKHKVIYAGDMNTEAVVMKLMWALGNFKDINDVKYFIESNIFQDRSL